LCSQLRNFRLKLAYDGTRFFGWQKTPDGPTIEEELQKVLEKILQQKIKLNAASRTDRGVHALSQTVNFKAFKAPSFISINRLLPPDMALLEIKEVPLNFHATLCAKSKTYRYEMTSAPFQMPCKRWYEWHYPANLDLELMQAAAKLLIGKKDFQALTNYRSYDLYAHTVRDVYAITVDETSPQSYRFTLTGESFLYKMIRNLVGLIVWVGDKKISLREVQALLDSKDRRKAGISAPACGLTLVSQSFD